MNYRNRCLLVCLALVVISCSRGPAEGTHAKPSSQATLTVSQQLPTPTPTMSLTPVSMQQAWGQVQFSQFSLDLGDRFFAPESQQNGITDDGQLCGVTSLMKTQNEDLSQDIGSLGLIDLHTGHITLLVTLPAGNVSITCTVTGSWVIWVQSSGHAFESADTNWQLKAFNRQTGEVRLLDQARVSDAQHQYLSIRPEPLASNGRVVWTTYSDDTPRDAQSEMYTFATGEKTVLAPHTSGPRLSWPWASWGDGVAKQIVFKNLETGQQVQLPLQSTPTTSAFARTSFVYSNSDYSQIIWVPSILAKPLNTVVIEDKHLDGSDFDQYPTLNDRLITWGGPNVWLVFDRKQQRQVKIPIGVRGLAGDLCGHYLLAWPPLTDEDSQAQHKGLPYHHVLQVLDTNTLP